MDHEAATRIAALLVKRGELDPVEGAGIPDALACLERARVRATAAGVLLGAGLWEPAYTTAYDAYRTAADAVVLSLGYRVPAVPGAHRIVMDVAHSVVSAITDVFAPVLAERFRRGRHESEYFDPGKPVEKSADDADWATRAAERAIDAADGFLSGR